MMTYAESLRTVSVDFDGRHLSGHYRVAGAVVIAYYAQEVKCTEANDSLSAEQIAQWLLKDMAVSSHHD
jgi:hypothetical protein